ncbi:MAG: DUF2398 family protein [Catenulispora sp.]|nr:DUF2398 family protein [Catenulispora sp.]
MAGARARRDAREAVLVDALVSVPLMSSSHPAFVEIEARTACLGERLRGSGRALRVGRGHLRLVDPGVRGLSGPDGVPLSPRAYASLVLSAVALSDAPARLPVSEVARRVTVLAAEAGIDAGVEGPVRWRASLVAALAVLRDWGVVFVVDGDPAAYVSDPAADALLGVDAALAGAVVC